MQITEELGDRYTVKELEIRYGRSRKTIYDRCEPLGIKLTRDGSKCYATKEQVRLLDEQDAHLKRGGTTKNFIPTACVVTEVHSTQLDPYSERVPVYTLGNTVHTTQQDVLSDLMYNFEKIIAENMPRKDPLWGLDRLEIAVDCQWLLTTSQIRELIGVYPKCKKGEKQFRRGTFAFFKKGKIGNETSWRVKKIVDNK